ncbi:amyloid fiber anchoring/assembly protein TapA [Ornithinibacillus halotolerans]|nr:amyloid fiber anchoring/assembly protein TapA [Ornithinibacillus halotolerans]
MSRLRKFNRHKKKKLIVMGKLVLIFYLALFSFTYLTGGTIAYFNTSSTGTLTFTAADTWFDGSNLVFIDKPVQNVKACPEVEISTRLKNEGIKMSGTTKYEIYFTNDKGNPKNHGELIVNNGIVPPLDNGEVTELTHLAKEAGFYTFKVYQREGYEGKSSEIWSKKIHVNCNAAKPNNDEQVQDDTVENEEQANEEVNSETEEKSNSDNSQPDENKEEQNESNQQSEEPETVEEEQNAEEESTSPDASTSDGQAEVNDQEEITEQGDENKE